MTSITIAIPDDRLRRLSQVAAHLGISVDDLVRVSIEEILDRPEESFDHALHYLFRKNESTYRRLA